MTTHALEPQLYCEDNEIQSRNVVQIEHCDWCKDDCLPCPDCADKARALEKEGYIVLLEDGWCIPLTNGRDEEANDDDQ